MAMQQPPNSGMTIKKMVILLVGLLLIIAGLRGKAGSMLAALIDTQALSSSATTNQAAVPGSTLPSNLVGTP